MKVLTGIYQADAGTVSYRGQPVHFKGPATPQDQDQHHPPGAEPAAGIVDCRQHLSRPQSPVPVLAASTTNSCAGGPAVCWRDSASNMGRMTRLGDLSIGEQQMVGDRQGALSFDASVIIMDEPTDALTDTETEQLFKVIRELREQGCGIVYISHRLKEIFEICDRVTVLRDGKWIGEKAVSDLMKTGSSR